IKPAPTRTAATKIAAARITKRVAEDGRSEPAGAGLEGASKADASVVFGVAWPTTSPACTSKSVAVGSGKAEPTTGAMKRYPRRGMVSTKRGFSDASPSTSRSRMTALFSPWSKSTKVSPGQSRLRNSSRVTISPGFSSSTTRTWKGCSGSLIRSPCLRSSQAFRSTSKTPKCKILATVAGLPMGQGGSISPLAPKVKVESCPIQDEPEGEGGFQYKMSLERVASWRIDKQRARSREIESGSEPGFSTSQPNHPIPGRKPTPGLPLDRTGAVPPAVPPTKPWGARTDPALSGQDDGPQPGAGDAADRALSEARHGAARGLPAASFSAALHPRRSRTAGHRR